MEIKVTELERHLDGCKNCCVTDERTQFCSVGMKLFQSSIKEMITESALKAQGPNPLNQQSNSLNQQSNENEVAKQ